MSNPQPIIVKGSVYYYDAEKSDSVSLPVKCEVCGKDIATDVPCWRDGERYMHIVCGEKVRHV